MDTLNLKVTFCVNTTLEHFARLLADHTKTLCRYPAEVLILAQPPDRMITLEHVILRPIRLPCQTLDALSQMELAMECVYYTQAALQENEQPIQFTAIKFRIEVLGPGRLTVTAECYFSKVVGVFSRLLLKICDYEEAREGIMDPGLLKELKELKAAASHAGSFISHPMGPSAIAWDEWQKLLEATPQPEERIELLSPTGKTTDTAEPMNHTEKELQTPTEDTESDTGRQSGPTVRTQERARVFKRLKEEHPTWTQWQVANTASDELGEQVTADTVRNTYRAMGWEWKRADRIR